MSRSRRRGSIGRGPCRPAAPGPRPTGQSAALARAGQVAAESSRRRAVAVALAAAAGVLAASLVAGACQWPAREAVGAAEPASATAGRVVARAARPVSIAIPAAGVDARVVPVGLREDGAMEVPAVDRAGWYRLGPRPGDNGPAVIVGHVDSREGPAVFFRLGELRRGDRIMVGRDGGATVAFTVERVERRPKEALPSSASGAPPPGRSCG